MATVRDSQVGRSKNSNSYKGQSLDKGTLVVYLRGGLGNQLFQLSAARTLSAVTARRALFSTMLLPRVHDQLRGVSRWPLEIRSLIRDDEEIDERWHQPLGATSLRSKLFLTLSYLTARSDVLARLTGVAVDFA